MSISSKSHDKERLAEINARREQIALRAKFDELKNRMEAVGSGGTEKPQSKFPRPSSAKKGRSNGWSADRKTGAKVSVTLRLDWEVVAHFRSDGRFWQTRINEALRGAAQREQDAP